MPCDGGTCLWPYALSTWSMNKKAELPQHYHSPDLHEWSCPSREKKTAGEEEGKLKC